MLRSRENQTPHIETKTKSYCRRKGSQGQARASRSGGRWEQRRSAHGSAGSSSAWPGAAGRVALQGVDGRGDGHLGGWAGLAKARHPKRARCFRQERARWEPARAAPRKRVMLSLAAGIHRRRAGAEDAGETDPVWASPSQSLPSSRQAGVRTNSGVVQVR